MSTFSVIALLLLATAAMASPSAPIADLTGADFHGGAAELYGGMQLGEPSTNYTYAQPTGARSTMQATFTLAKIPTEPLFLHLKARDDDYGTRCRIAIELNGRAVFEGKNEFSGKAWQVRKYPIPAGALREGPNTLTISNREPQGKIGMPPWFMVARATLAPESFRLVRDIRKDFWFDLPTRMREFPEPLAPGQKPGFPIRGTKGWMWTPAQYLAEIPMLAKCKMNFLMNCYTSMGDTEHYRWGNPEFNRWWEDLPEAKKQAYEQIVRECRKQGIQFCFSMNPNLSSKRPLRYDSEEDINQLWKHYAWMQGLGVKWFNISLDDISEGIEASGQARVVNEIYHRLRARDPEAKMIFTPSIYWGDGTPAHERPYLETLARELDKNVYLFWTGDSVVGNITRRAAESYLEITGHRLFLWDNYPVNDANPTMHLGPVVNRDPDLCEVVDGYMCNPLCQQNEANRIPMFTCADYAYNPAVYDPIRSVGQAILHLEDTDAGREVLHDLVERYPGFILYGKPHTGLNPVREQFARIAAMPHSRYIAEAMIRDLESLAWKMDKLFPTRYNPEKTTLRNDIAYLRKMAEKYSNQE